MRKVWVGAGALVLLGVAVAAVAAVSRSGGGGDRKLIKADEVAKAFSAHAITFRNPGSLVIAPEAHVAKPLANLSNEGTPGQSGYMTVVVTRSISDALKLDKLRFTSSDHDECGRPLSRDVTNFRVNNVVVQFDSCSRGCPPRPKRGASQACNLWAKPFREAPAATLKDVVSALSSLGHVSSP
jgi:hypothetical protein